MTAPPPMDRIAALRQLQEQAKLIHTECSARLDGHTNSAPLARPAEIAVLAIQAPAAYEIVRRALSCHEHAIQPELLDIVEAHLEDWRHHVEAEYSATVAEMQSVERFGGTTDGSISSHLRDIFRQVFTAHCERMEHRVRAAVCASQSEATGRAGLPPSAVEVLVQIYQHRHHLNTVENAIIAKSIGITADQCRTWFQNRRNKQRMRHRDALANERTPPPEITDVPQPRRLASALHLPPERAIAVELRLEDAQPVAWADQPYTTSRPPHLHPSLVQQEASNSQPGQGRPLAGGRRMKGLPKRVYQQPRAQNSTDEVDRSLLVSEGSTCSSGWSSSGESSREGSPLPPVFSSPLMHNAAVPQSILVPTSHGFDFGGMSMPTYQMPMPGGMLATQQQPLLPIDRPFAFPACQTQHTGDFSEPLTYSAFEANPAPFGAPGGVQLPFAQDGFPAAVQDQDRPQAFPVSTNANLSIGLGNLMDSSMDMFGLPSGNAAAFSNVLSNVLANGQDLSTVLNGGGSGDMMMWGGGAGAQEAEVATLAQQAATHTSISSDLGMGQNDLGGQGDVDMAAFMEANGGMDFGMDIGIEAGIGAGLDLDADMLAMLSLTFLANSSPPGSIPDSASRAESALGDVNGMDFDFDFALNLDAQSQPMSSPSASWVASSPSSADMSRRSSAPGVPLPFPSIDNILAHIAPLSSITPTSCDATSEPAPATNAMPIVSSATPATYTYGQGQEVSAFDEAAEYGLEDVAWDYVNSSAYSPDEPTFSIQPRPRNITGSTESTVGAASRVVSLASSDVSLVSDASSSSDASATLEPAPVSASRATTPVLSITPPTPGLFEPMRHTMSPAPVHQAESAELASLESMSVEEMNDLLASGGMLVEADMEEDIVSGEGNGQYGLTGLAELPFAEVSDDERME